MALSVCPSHYDFEDCSEKKNWSRLGKKWLHPLKWHGSTNSSTFESGAKIVPQVELSYVTWDGSRGGAVLVPLFISVWHKWHRSSCCINFIGILCGTACATAMAYSTVGAMARCSNMYAFSYSKFHVPQLFWDGGGAINWTADLWIWVLSWHYNHL